MLLELEQTVRRLVNEILGVKGLILTVSLSIKEYKCNELASCVRGEKDILHCVVLQKIAFIQYFSHTRSIIVFLQTLRET